MSNPLIDFESTTALRQQRLEKENARKEMLNKVRRQHEQIQKEKEQSIRKGDDSWMLPSVERSIEKQTGKKKKKDKKKKEKKKKSKKKSRRSSSISSGSEDEMEWVEEKREEPQQKREEPQQKREEPQQKREGWMEMSSLCGVFSRDEMRIRDGNSRVLDKQKEKNKEPDKPGSHALELNPYFKQGGSGLPSQETTPSAGGRGVSSAWLRKSFQRAEEQAKEEGVPLEEIAEKRWGSLEVFNQMLREAEEREVTPKQEDRRRDHRKVSAQRRLKSPRRNTRRSPRSRSVSSDSDDSHRRHRRRRRSSSSPRRRRSRCRSRDRSPSNRRRMMRPGDGKEVKDSTRPEVAVWDKKSLLPSSRSSASGGWKRSKVEEKVEAEKRREEKVEAEKRKEESPDRAKVSSPKNLPYEAPDEDKAPKQPKVLTDHELNQLGAKIIKAELMGNETLAKKLKNKLERCREESQRAIKERIEGGATEVGGAKEEEEVLLTATNARGFTRPMPHTEESRGKVRRKPKASSATDGSRESYFPDDNKFSLREMFEKEKLGTSSDSDAMFVRAAAQAHKATLDDDYTLDDSFVDKTAVREDASVQNSRDRMKAIMDHQKREKALSNCSHCLDSSKLQKHLIVSLGGKSYLSLPPYQSLVTGHCLIVPREHLATGTLIDEDTWAEMKSYRQSLVQFFSSRDEDVLFMECCMRLGTHPHTVTHCIPLPREMGDLAPIYYKKAIQESESDCQNVKLVDLSGRDVRRALPKGFPYFAVDFGSQGGYAHVIEDEQTFPLYFGLSVIGGMLDIEPQLWRKPKQEKFDEQRRKVLNFSKEYEKFDPENK